VNAVIIVLQDCIEYRAAVRELAGRVIFNQASVKESTPTLIDYHLRRG